MYVLGDATAETLQKVAEGYPALFPYALAIPQLWAAGSFAIFFVEILVITWNKQHAGWTVKAGVILAITITVVHLTGFLVLHASNPIDSDSALEPEMIHIQEGGDHDTSSAADPQSRPPDRAQRGGN
ncbi:hypothetical protein FRB94_010620 [Tulasnella sp. JGI-2019a]|nr:hypothetical protein FRB94_010620 [Tulasnella sp. JGI-2019a]